MEIPPVAPVSAPVSLFDSAAITIVLSVLCVCVFFDVGAVAFQSYVESIPQKLLLIEMLQLIAYIKGGIERLDITLLLNYLVFHTLLAFSTPYLVSWENQKIRKLGVTAARSFA